MKILAIDKFYFIKGGAERYFFELKAILEENGHVVIPFSVKNPNNLQSIYDKYFVDPINFDGLSKYQALLQSPKIMSRIVYSLHAKDKLRKLLRDVKPDIAHLHMIDHQLSPSILDVLKEEKIPVIQTLHQYKLVCPNYRFYNSRTETVCEKCLDGHFWHPIIERCHKGSLITSFPLAIEAYVHRWIKIYDKIDLFHAPSLFMKKKMIQGGYHPDRIVHRYYAIQLNKYPFSKEYEDYAIYYGRLSEEKGIPVLFKAMKRVHGLRLLIVGEGPQRRALEGIKSDMNLKNVEFLGYQTGSALQRLVAKSKFVVVPSQWYDNSPLVIYEAFALGKPVIGSDIGGISELIDHGQNGFLFSPEDSNSLYYYMDTLAKDSKKVKEYGRNARLKAEKEFNPDEHYKWILNIYRQLLNK